MTYRQNQWWFNVPLNESINSEMAANANSVCETRFKDQKGSAIRLSKQGNKIVQHLFEITADYAILWVTRIGGHIHTHSHHMYDKIPKRKLNFRHKNYWNSILGKSYVLLHDRQHNLSITQTLSLHAPVMQMSSVLASPYGWIGND